MSYYEDIYEAVKSEIPREDFDSMVEEIVEKSKWVIGPRAAALYIAVTMGKKFDKAPLEPIIGRVLDVGQVRKSRGREGETPYVLFTLVNQDSKLLCVAFGEHHIRKLRDAEDRVVMLKDYTIAKLEKVTMVKVKEASIIEFLPDDVLPPIAELEPAWSESLKKGLENEETFLFKVFFIDEKIDELLVCPHCGREVDRRGKDFACPEHGFVHPEKRKIWRFIVGDKSGVYDAVSKTPPPKASIVGRIGIVKGYFGGLELNIKKFYDVSEPVL